MADNLQVNQGTGPAVRTLEDASSVHWPVGVVAYAAQVGTPDVILIPTAQSLSDTTTNPATITTGACLLLYDGAQWARARGDISFGLDVDVTRLPVSSRDFDSGPGSENVMLVGLAVPAAGGAQIVGTASAPLRIDPTGTTAQPVSGTVSASQNGTWSVRAQDGAGNNLESATSSPSGAERGLIVRNIPSGTQTVSGNVSASQAGSWNVGLLAGSNNIGDVDVVSLPSNTVAGTTAVTLDYDTGAGTQQMLMIGIAIPAAGGAVAGGTATNPLRVDPTGTTTQPVSGTVSAQQSGTWNIQALAGATVSHGASDSENPHKTGARATSALAGETPVSTGQRTHHYATLDGRALNQPYCAPDDIIDNTVSTNTTNDVVVLSAQGTDIRTYVSTIVIANTSNTDVTVAIKNGTATRMVVPVPANGGVVLNMPVHLRGGVNTAWSIASSAAASTVYATMIGYRSKV